MNPRIDKVVYWMVTREKMRLRKEAGQEYPFSPDKIMAHTRFTNVRREDDKVTKYLASTEWREKWSEDIVPKLVVSRFVNYIPSLEEVLANGGWQNSEEVLWERYDRGEKVWGSAYTITTCGRPMDKIAYL